MTVSDEDFQSVMRGLAEVKTIRNGTADTATYRVHVPKDFDTKLIRGRLGLTQVEFAARFGFSVGAVRDWEQGRKMPDASTRAFLKVIAREPEAVMKALDAA